MIHESPRSRRHTATRERILQAATAQLGVRGPDGVTIAALADAVDLTPAAIYRYFPSKEAIVAEAGLAVVARHAAELAAVAAQVAPHADAGIRALRQVLAIAAAWRTGILEDPIRAQIIGRVAGDPSALLPDDAAGALVPPALEAIAPLVAALATAPLAPGDPFERAIALLAAQQGVLALAKLQRLTPLLPVARLAAGVPPALLRGWGAPETALTEALS